MVHVLFRANDMGDTPLLLNLSSYILHNTKTVGNLLLSHIKHRSDLICDQLLKQFTVYFVTGLFMQPM